MERMSSQPKHDVRSRLGAACLAVTLLTGGAAVVAPATSWAGTGGTGETVAPWSESEDADDRGTPPSGDTDGPGAPESEQPEQPGELPANPEPSDPATPTPVPTAEPTQTPTPAPSSPSPEPSTPSPAPTDTPAPPAEPPAEPVDPTRVEPGPRTPPSTAARLGALLRLPAAAAPTPAPTPGDEVHLDGGPDVGGSAELSASVAPEAATGQTDAVQVGALNDGAGAALAHPVVWLPWAGALGAVAAAVAVVLVRGGRQIGR